MAALERGWRVPADHPALAGHFPGQPIVPGVVLLDHVILLAQSMAARPPAGWRVTQAKFLSPARPGDDLVFALGEGPRGGLAFSVRCGDREIAAGSLAPPEP
jgi:3-hydroxyacyl-[acyl-carrier-protein] dehydratase